MLLFTITIMIVCAIGSNWVISLPLISAIILSVVAISGTRYVIEGNTLIVYHFFRAHRIPIAKIKSATPAKGFLTGPALSSDRVSLRFTDRSVLKSSKPMEISPRNRDEFIAQLKKLNPAIV